MRYGYRRARAARLRRVLGGDAGGGARAARWRRRSRPDPTPLRTVDVEDVDRLAGSAASRSRAGWSGPSGAAGTPARRASSTWATVAAARCPSTRLVLAERPGYAYLVMDSRGQNGDTPDNHDRATSRPRILGFVTSGIDDPAHATTTAALITDAVLAVDAVREAPVRGPGRVIVDGAEPGRRPRSRRRGPRRPDPGGDAWTCRSCATSARAIELTDAGAYGESRWHTWRSAVTEREAVRRTLSYVTACHFAAPGDGAGPVLDRVACDTLVPAGDGHRRPQCITAARQRSGCGPSTGTMPASCTSSSSASPSLNGWGWRPLTERSRQTELAAGYGAGMTPMTGHGVAAAGHHRRDGRPDGPADRAGRDRGPVRDRAPPRPALPGAVRAGRPRARVHPGDPAHHPRAGPRPARVPAAAPVRRGVRDAAPGPAREPVAHHPAVDRARDLHDRRRRRRRPGPGPGLGWAAAFALGAIVAPTDALAATTVFRRLGVPRIVRDARRGRGAVQRRDRR